MASTILGRRGLGNRVHARGRTAVSLAGRSGGGGDDVALGGAGVDRHLLRAELAGVQLDERGRLGERDGVGDLGEDLREGTSSAAQMEATARWTPPSARARSRTCSPGSRSPRRRAAELRPCSSLWRRRTSPSRRRNSTILCSVLSVGRRSGSWLHQPTTEPQRVSAHSTAFASLVSRIRPSPGGCGYGAAMPLPIEDYALIGDTGRAPSSARTGRSTGCACPASTAPPASPRSSATATTAAG